MTLPTSGTITLKQIITEFGGPTPSTLRQYLAGGSYVPAGTANGTGIAIPSSGTIDLRHFYGATKFTNVTYTYVGTATDTTGTQTIPAGATKLVIEIWGGGGGGGGALLLGMADTDGDAGSGGGYSRSSAYNVVNKAGNTISYTAGHYGNRGTGRKNSSGTLTDGTNGGNSSITVSTIVSAQFAGGGKGGPGASSVVLTGGSASGGFVNTTGSNNAVQTAITGNTGYSSGAGGNGGIVGGNGTIGGNGAVRFTFTVGG